MNNGKLKKGINSKKFMLLSFINSNINSIEPLHAGVTRYFLGAVILELIIKIFYEFDKKEEAPFTHNILKLFNSFNTESKNFILDKYNDSIKRHQNIPEKIIIHSLQEVLKENPKLIKNFKYDGMGIQANYSIDNIFLKEIFSEIEKRQKLLDI